MSHFVVDVEADGPVPGLYSMVSFGIVKVDKELNTAYFGRCQPISEQWIPEALAVSGYTREETMKFLEPEVIMKDLTCWLNRVNEGKRMYFWSDNNGFDWQFMNYYFHAFADGNPFGHSSSNIGSLFKGAERTMFKNFKHLRKTKHTHNPVDDAMGNAEALCRILTDYKIKNKIL